MTEYKIEWYGSKMLFSFENIINFLKIYLKFRMVSWNPYSYIILIWRRAYICINRLLTLIVTEKKIFLIRADFTPRILVICKRKLRAQQMIKPIRGIIFTDFILLTTVFCSSLHFMLWNVKKCFVKLILKSKRFDKLKPKNCNMLFFWITIKIKYF